VASGGTTETATFPEISPFYISPGSLSAQDIDAQYNQQLHVFGALIDPFNSVHGYTGILPVKEVRLPPWIVEKALQSMTFFFEMGPLVVPSDVPNTYNPNFPITAKSYDAANTTLVPGIEISVPTMSVGDWIWLQPYSEGCNPMGLAKNQDDKARFEAAPYTALEGYLQLRGPILQNTADKPA
jgi:hypothetical protein